MRSIRKSYCIYVQYLNLKVEYIIKVDYFLKKHCTYKLYKKSDTL